MVHTRLQCILGTVVAEGTYQTTVYTWHTPVADFTHHTTVHTWHTGSSWYIRDCSVYLAQWQQLVHTRLQCIPGTPVADGTHQIAVYTWHTGNRWYTPDYSVYLAHTGSRWYIPDYSVYLTHWQQMVHTRLQCIPGKPVADGTHQTSISALVPLWHQDFHPSIENNVVNCIGRRWQLASRRRLLQISGQPGVS